MRSTKIYFNDLNPEAQKRVLEFYGMKDESEGNWEVEPLAILDVEDEEDEVLHKQNIENGLADEDTAEPPFNHEYHNWEGE